MKRLKRKLLSVILCFAFVFALLVIGAKNRRSVDVESSSVEHAGSTEFCVVIDAGHGGFDPGKVGIDDVLEKDINLSIALLLKKYLEAEDIQVVMTREEDEGLYRESDSNKKVQDMKNRIAVIEAADPDITVSIHQNSYPEEYVHGAQVFYYENSTEGKILAESIQTQIVELLDPENTRQIKGNGSYYLLKKTPVPIVIVECGFLSNQEETKKLCDQEYQQRIAWAIHMGIVRYLNENVAN